MESYTWAYRQPHLFLAGAKAQGYQPENSTELTSEMVTFSSGFKGQKLNIIFRILFLLVYIMLSFRYFRLRTHKTNKILVLDGAFVFFLCF